MERKFDFISRITRMLELSSLNIELMMFLYASQTLDSKRLRRSV